MSDPPRLLDNATNGLSSRLLRAGLDEQPSDKVLHRTLAAAGTGIAIASSTTGAAAASGSGPVALLAIAKWVGMGALGGLVTVTAATSLTPPNRSQSDPITQKHAQESPSPRRGPIAEIKAADSDQPALTNYPDNTPSLPLASREKPQPSSDAHRSMETMPSYDPPSVALPPTPPAKPPAPLAEEVMLVDRGWAAIRSKEFARTLADLDVYERKFPNMSLLPEVLSLRMQAENGLDHSERAKAYARRILSGFPQSPHSARARDILAGK